MLGIYLSPSGNHEAQIKAIRKITETWADRIQVGFLQRGEVWAALQTTIAKCIEYLLQALTLTPKECKHILAPSWSSKGGNSSFHTNVIDACTSGGLRLWNHQSTYIPRLRMDTVYRGSYMDVFSYRTTPENCSRRCTTQNGSYIGFSNTTTVESSTMVHY